ncbi:hypothetical protein [Pseudonocardia spirodelae]|uniref:Uncharacterized protein n=1 Tax=Pseudonocardia spirodelae TaxID=3133431 RepID=A0ABU8T940_9PSEU
MPAAAYGNAGAVRTAAQLPADHVGRVDGLVREVVDGPGERLVSVLGDDLQHAGQAAYLRGLLGV